MLDNPPISRVQNRALGGRIRYGKSKNKKGGYWISRGSNLNEEISRCGGGFCYCEAAIVEAIVEAEARGILAFSSTTMTTHSG